MLKLIYPVNREVGKEEGDPFSLLGTDRTASARRINCINIYSTYIDI